jgi:MFS family permease
MVEDGAVARAWSAARSIDRPLALLAAISFIVQVGVAVMLPLLPLYAISLGASPFVLGLLTSSFAVANTLGGLSAGFLAERFQPRRLVAGGIGFYAAANLLIATASAALPLIVFRTAAGVGGGVSAMGERLYLTAAVDRARLAMSNGILSAAGASGQVVGPVIGGVLAAMADVRAPFIVVAITSTIGAIGALFLPRPAEQATERNGSRGERSHAAATDASAAATDVGAAMAEARDAAAIEPPVAIPAADSPSATPSAAVRSTTAILATLFVVQLAFQAGFGAFITTFAPFATDRLDWSTAEIGIAFALFGLGTIVLGPWLGRLADRRGRRDVALLSCVLLAAFPIVFLAEAPRWVIYPTMFLAGAGETGLEAAWFALLGEATDAGRRSRAFATISSVANLGIVVGATAAAFAWERAGDVGAGMVIFVVATAVIAVGLATLPRDRPAVGGEVSELR